MKRMSTSRIRATAATMVPGVFLFLAATCAVAQETRGLSEMRIAEQHAAAAAQAQDLQQAKAQLQQSLNCLVGSRAAEYRAEAGNPCNGEAALRKLPQGSANKIRAEKAIRLAAVGVTFHDFKPAHYTAQAVQAVLEEATGR